MQIARCAVRSSCTVHTLLRNPGEKTRSNPHRRRFPFGASVALRMFRPAIILRALGLRDGYASTGYSSRIQVRQGIALGGNRIFLEPLVDGGDQGDLI